MSNPKLTILIGQAIEKLRELPDNSVHVIVTSPPYFNLRKYGVQGWAAREEWFLRFTTAKNKLDFCESMPWIGPITKYHLAKNFGVQCCKPDRHIRRISGITGETPFEFCDRVARENGETVVVVDTVVWRAANLGLV
jgi:hypothetical protein